MTGVVKQSKHEMYRFALVGAMTLGYTAYLGRPLSNRAFMNAATLAGSSVASEFVVRNVMGSIVSSAGIKAPFHMAAEAAGSGFIYAMAYPRVIGGRSPGFTSLAYTGALIDGAAQIAGPRVSKVLSGDDDAYTAY